MDEVSLHDESCFITLTYKETDGNLHKDDLQRFWKRLRKRISPIKIRYFACGEYGGKGNRPHYHAIVFGWRPDDLKLVSCVGYDCRYSSAMLADVWHLGFVSVGDVTFASAKYCAKYLAKLDDRPHEVKPFTLMSRRPGIGQGVVTPDLLVTGIRYFDGKSYTVPKYYLSELEKQGYNVDVLKARREEVAQNLSPTYMQEADFEELRARKKFSLEKLRR